MQYEYGATLKHNKHPDSIMCTPLLYKHTLRICAELKRV